MAVEFRVALPACGPVVRAATPRATVHASNSLAGLRDLQSFGKLLLALGASFGYDVCCKRRFLAQAADTKAFH
jgi:hypothetical protein